MQQQGTMLIWQDLNKQTTTFSCFSLAFSFWPPLKTIEIFIIDNTAGVVVFMYDRMHLSVKAWKTLGRYCTVLTGTSSSIVLLASQVIWCKLFYIVQYVHTSIACTEVPIFWLLPAATQWNMDAAKTYSLAGSIYSYCSAAMQCNANMNGPIIVYNPLRWNSRTTCIVVS